MLDYAFSKKLELLHSECNIPICLLTDNTSLFDLISKGSWASDRRLIIDIPAANEPFKNQHISDIESIRSGNNLVDRLTKRMSPASLRQTTNGRLTNEPVRWII